MKHVAIVLLALAVVTAGSNAQPTPAPKNGVITPGSNVDPGMKVVPPKTPTTMPVVRPPGSAKPDRHRHVTVVPK